MPAAAVIPAPIAYIKVAAVKKLVVHSLVCQTRTAPLQEHVSNRLRAILLENASSLD